MKKPTREDSQDGFSLIEILIAIVITALISLVSAKVLIESSNSLGKVASESSYNLQVSTFTKTVQRDFRSSQDLYLYSTAPVSTKICRNSSDSDWNIGSPTLNRPLFTVVKLVIDTGVSSWQVPQTEWNTYQIKKVDLGANDSANIYEIWRNTCKTTPETKTLSQDLQLPDTTTFTSKPVLSLGDTLCQNTGVFLGIEKKNNIGKNFCPSELTVPANNILTGQSLLTCLGNNISACPISTTAISSTKSIFRYTLSIPFAGCSPAILSILAPSNNCPTGAGLSIISNPLSNLGRAVNS